MKTLFQNFAKCCFEQDPAYPSYMSDGTKRYVVFRKIVSFDGTLTVAGIKLS